MRKALSKQEHDTIKSKLIENCRICWKQYGYKKTSVSELASMSGISTGAFYVFYPSKEILFVETANAFTKKLYEIMAKCKSQKTTKQDFSDRFKQCIDRLFENKWIFSLREHSETFMRKLPEKIFEQDFNQDVLDVATVINLYGLIPKVPIEKIVAVFHTLLMSIYLTEIIGTPHKQALYLLIDSVMVNLFE